MPAWQGVKEQREKKEGTEEESEITDEKYLLSINNEESEEESEEEIEKEETTKADTLHSILVVNEDVGFLKRIRERLLGRYNVVVVKSEEQALAYLQKQEAIDSERSEHE